MKKYLAPAAIILSVGISVIAWMKHTESVELRIENRKSENNISILSNRIDSLLEVNSHLEEVIEQNDILAARLIQDYQELKMEIEK